MILMGDHSEVGNGVDRRATNGRNGVHKSANGNGVAALRSQTWFGHDREEVTRILIQSLNDLGYDHAAQTLGHESGYELEGPTVAAFRNAVLHGDWPEAEALLFGTGFDGSGVGFDGGSGKRAASGYREWDYRGYGGGLKLADGANREEMLFWMRQQKYLEYLELRDLGAALMVLRQELTPLNRDISRLHALSSLMMCQSVEDLKTQANWDGAAGQSRRHLLSELSRSISPSVMIPEHRLAVLLSEVKSHWMQNCLFHNTVESPSLYTDHSCTRDGFPTVPVRQLADHSDEVWFLSFSNDGSKLATASADHLVLIYDTQTWEILHRLDGHEAGVCYLSWSPDDSKLLTSTKEPECDARIWDANTGEILHHLTEFKQPVTATAWAPDGETFVIGTTDSAKALSVWTINDDGSEEIVFEWKERIRVFDLSLSPDGQRLVVLLEKGILVYDFPTRERIGEYKFDDFRMTSVRISSDSKHMLVGMNPNRIRLLVIDTGECVRTFEGHKQTHYMIRSGFGGANEGFVVSGSEDKKIYVWRTTGHPVEELTAVDSGCVNAVSWHPQNPRIFASAGDDGRVRIWSTTPETKTSHYDDSWDR
ncbi:WD repeat-containing protein-like protein [Trichodelitschia bisporula]|uniref:WD repeat-containing protein-like protein n=1 Tax=Trichodelitschia bisporula TaxID=703511 RepID=A0A6G1I4K3_9PEZI|nr:WD repeat-containing protein-like protein [Trichodelitschia bisporula]